MKITCLQERIARSQLNCFVKKAKKVVANFVFLLLQKRKNLFRHWQKRFLDRSERKELLRFVICSTKYNSIFSHFCVFGWNCFWRTSSKELLLLATIKLEKNNNKFCWTFNNVREKATSFSQQWFYEVSANFSLFFSTKV